MNRLFTTYRQLSIKAKLMVVLMTTCFVTALCVSLIFAAMALTALRQEQREDLSALAALVSTNTSAALLRNDPNAALKAIASLHVVDDVREICILTVDGKIFARNTVQKAAAKPLPLARAVRAASAVLPVAAIPFLDSFSLATVTRPILLQAQRVGDVVVRADTSRFVHSIYLCIVMELVVMAGAFVVAYLFSSRFQELISTPIIRLAYTMREVSSTKNFTLRVGEGGSDEIGLLYDGFNEMLCEIEDRNKILRQRQEHLQQLAHFDPLTRLPNRSLFYDRLTQAMHHAHRDKEMVALLFIDLDRFKDVNDTLGHRMGDLLLVEVGRRLASVVRSCDTAARLGGDEFTVFSQNVGSLENARTFAEAIIGLFSTPFQLEGQEIFVTASLGITLFPDDGRKVDELLINADMAMYAAKESGKNTFKFFDKKMNNESSERVSLQADLRRGLEREEFFLLYQPKVNTSNYEITSVEALIRWNHPTLGLVLPGKFIPLAEENGFITPLTEWVLLTACRHAMEWLEGGHPIRVAVNIPAYHFKREEVVTTVRRVLGATGLDPSLLELEITESSLVQNNDYTLKALQELKQMGVTISIDDFGTGYSSLSYLNRFQVDNLKIDRSFIWNMTKSEEDRSIVSTIIAMAAALKMKVVAEGVETVDQLSILRESGCQVIQGYLFSRPVAVEHLSAMLADKSLASRAISEMVSPG